MMTTKQEWRGNWNSLAGSVREKYGQITDNELAEVRGDTEQLVGLIQRKTGQSREQVESYVHDLCERNETSMDQLSARASAYAETAGEKFREGYEQVAEQARYGYQQSAQTVSKHPLESVVAALGVGLITGIAIGISLSAPRRYEPTWRDRWLS